MLYELDEIERATFDGKVSPPTAGGWDTPSMVAAWSRSETPSLKTLKLRKRDEPLTPWYARGIADMVRLRELEEDATTCASCGAGTWLEIDGVGSCHECIRMLRFAGCPAGTREEAYRVR